MKKSNILYLVLIIVIILTVLVIPRGFAANSLDYKFTFSGSYEEVWTMTKGNFESVEGCGGAPHYEMILNENGDFLIKWKGEAPTSDGKETLTCDAVIYDETLSGSKTVSGKLIIDINYKASKNVLNSDITLSLSKTNSSYDLSSNLIDYVETVSVNLSGDGLTVDCPVGGTSCSVKATKFDGDHRYSGTITYKDSNNLTRTTNISILVHTGYIYLNAGGYGSCNFAANGYIEDANGLYKKVLDTSSALPTCETDIDRYFLLEFAGWYPTTVEAVKSGNTEIAFRDITVGTCTEAEGFIPAGSAANGSSTYYFSCYKYKEGFELVPDIGVIKGLTGKYREINGEFIVEGHTLVLPEVVIENENLKDKIKFEGWYDAETNEVIPAGTEISSGTKMPRFLRAKFKQIADTDTHSYKAGMIIGQNELLSKILNLDVEFTSCKSSSDPTVVQINNSSECQLYANSLGKSTITAEATIDGTKNIYDIEIEVFEELSSTDFIQGGMLRDGDTEVSWEEYLDYNAETQSTIGSVTSCDYYYVWADGTRTGAAVSGIHTFNIYKAKPDAEGCDGSRQYYALCLDPGLRGANETYGGGNGHYYKKIESLDYATGTVSRDAALYYLVSQIAGESLNYEKYAAVNFLGRVIQYMYGWNNNSSSANIYNDQNIAYKAIANANKNANGSFKSEFTLPSGYTFANYEGTIKKYYKDAITAKYPKTDFDSNGIKSENAAHDNKWEGTTYVANRTGTLVLPEGTNSSDFEFVPNCSYEGFTCTVNSFRQQGSSNKWDYDVTVRVDLSNRSLPDLPSGQDSKLAFKLSFKNGSANGNAFIIGHQNHQEMYQRMLLINPGSNDYYLYFNLKTGASCNLDADILDYRKHCTSTGCDDVIRIDYFMALGCCSKIEDKESPVFKYLCSGGDCAYSTMLPMCRYSASSANENDLFNIDEAMDAFGNEKYQCVIDIPNTNNSNLTDVVGNKFELDQYKGNRYCSVSCKEDWYISTSAYGNFTNENAIVAGSYFQIRNDVFVGGARTCVTTYINVDQYKNDIKDLTTKMVEAWNNYSKATAKYDAIDKATINESVKNYYSSHSTETWCDSYEKDDDGHDTDVCASSHEYELYYKDGTCDEFKINVNYNYVKAQGGNGSDSYEIKTDNTTEGSSGGSGVSGTAGSCATQTGEDIKKIALAEANSEIDNYRTEVNNIKATIDEYSNYMAECQNFELITVSEYNEFKDGSTVEPAYGSGNVYTSAHVSKSANSVQINTVFSPFIEYSYDETEFMDKLKPENYMVPYTAANNEKFSTVTDRTILKNTNEFMGIENACSSEAIGTIDAAAGGKDIHLCRHKYQTVGISGSSSAKANDIYGKNGPTGSSSKKLNTAVSSFNGGILCTTASGTTKVEDASSYCGDGTFYYYNVNFIKQSLENGSFWKNKGTWYVNSADEKSHGDTLAEAAQASYLTFKDEETTSPLGGDNVFPISMNTRRNLYQYAYSFYNIGMYSDGSLGRIIGGPRSALNRTAESTKQTVIAYNTHSCFYEVVESVCRCCGEPITSYVVTDGGTTTNYIEENGGFYQESDYIVPSTQATLAMYTNSVSLSNVSSAAKRVLGANWQAQTPFYYNGNTFCQGAGCVQGGTNQGAELLEQIQGFGDSIYTKYPDYSFTLGPSEMAKVKEYNKNHSYAIDTKNLINYGKTAHVSSGTSGYDVKGNEENYKINFNHYGSKYLEQLKEDGLVTKEFRGKTLIDRTAKAVCYVEEGNVDDIYTNETYANCRWIDYISTSNKDENNNNIKVRLAFK